ncbi:MAG: hypothetical protein GXP58_10380 [Deltaproteobacteria bacterium]|nr:hypothetical protein [Deltaproteobacteria bacterium]
MERNLPVVFKGIPLRGLLAGISIVLTLFPFIFVEFPPATDLPQHLCQIYLLNKTLSGQTHLYSINWYSPDNLVYLLIYAARNLFAPIFAGKLSLIVLVLSWGMAIHLLAWKRKRPLGNALLALLLVFNLSLYWGFLNFLIGWPFFVLWFMAALHPFSRRRGVLLIFLSFLLYFCHALWFLIGAAWLLLYNLIHWKGWKSLIYRLSPLFPTGLLAAFWYQSFSKVRESAGFDVAAHWVTSPLDRLAPGYLVNSMFGGIQGNTEAIAAVVILAWLLLSFFTNRNRFTEKIDKELLTAALLFLCIYFFAPEKYMNTIFFAQRWFPIVSIFLLLSFPAPALEHKIQQLSLGAVLAFFLFQTAWAWHLFQTKEISGLRRSLMLLPAKQRVLGLDFVKTSRYIKGRPFLQTFAYAQAVKGGSLNFSFAEHASGIVQFRKQRPPHWTPGLEWNAQWVKIRDILAFNYLLINGTQETQNIFDALPILKPVTKRGRWRLYRVTR